jgi:hypothetical protein
VQSATVWCCSFAPVTLALYFSVDNKMVIFILSILNALFWHFLLGKDSFLYYLVSTLSAPILIMFCLAGQAVDLRWVSFPGLLLMWLVFIIISILVGLAFKIDKRKNE